MSLAEAASLFSSPKAPSVPVSWRPRARPLAPIAVAARGSAAVALAEKMLRRSADEPARIQGVGGRGLILLVAEEAAGALPWVDGAFYLGRDSDAPLLLLPTAQSPSIHPNLLERAILRTRDRSAGPFAILLDPPAVVPAGEALPLARERLAAWLEDHLSQRPGGSG